MKNTKVPFWMFNDFNITGAEGEENSSGSNEGGGEGGEGQGEGGEGSGEGESSGGDSGGDSGGAGSKEALKADLAKERRDRQKADRELAALKKEKEDREKAEMSENDRLKADLQKESERATKLAAGYVRTRLDTAIEKMARELKFRDTDDAIVMVDRSLIEFEQDKDDPSQVKITEATVKSAVKKIADKKPHLLTTGTNDGERSGSGFGGSGSNNGRGKRTEDEALIDKYPALRG